MTTGGTEFAFKVVATDEASTRIQAINKAVAELTGSLTGATSAYTALSSAQKKITNTKVSNRGATSDADKAAKAEERARKEAEKRAAQIARDAQAEERYLSRSTQMIEQKTAADARSTARMMGTSNQRIAALDTEITRARAVAEQYKRDADLAQQLSRAADRAKATSANGRYGAAGDPQAAAAARTAAQSYTIALGRQKAAEADVKAAIAAKTAEQQRATSEMQRAAAAVAAYEAKQRAATSANNQNAVSLTTVRYALYQVAAAYQAISNQLVDGLQDIATTSIAFEQAFAQVERTSGLGQKAAAGLEGASAEIAVLRANLVGLSRDIPVSFENLASIASLGSQLGIDSENVAQFTSVVAKFTAQSNVSAEQSAMYFGRLQNILDVPTSKFENLGSAVAELGVSSVATESEILSVTTQIGAMANNAGFSAEYVLGLGTALASVRVAPELARGTTTRVFQTITKAAAEGGSTLEAYARVLGVTADEAAKLWETDPDTFFSKLITGLGQANEAGVNLYPTLAALGIKGSRDIPTITRLANSYKLLAEYTGLAADSYASGTYLDTSFETLNTKTAASITKMTSSFKAFEDSIGQAFLPVIKGVADALNGLFGWLSKLDPTITGALVGVVAGVAILLAFRAGLALTAAAIFAMRSAAEGLGVSSLRAGSLIGALFKTTKQQAVAAREATVATDGLIAANRALALVGVQSTASVNATSVAMGAEAVAARGATVAVGGLAAGTGAVVAPAAAATGALARLGIATKGLFAAIGPAGWLLIGLTTVASLFIGAASEADDLAIANEELKQKQDELNSSWINSGDGAEALAKAIEADTKAYKDAGNQATKANGVYTVSSKTVSELADSMRKTNTVLTDISGKPRDLGDELTHTSAGADAVKASLDAAAGAAPKTATEIDGTTTAVENLTTALGNNVIEWGKKAAAEQLSTAFNATSGLQDALTRIPKETLKAALIAGQTEGAAGVNRVLAATRATTEQMLAKINANIAASEAKIASMQADLDIDAQIGPSDTALSEARKASMREEIAAAQSFIATQKQELDFQNQQIAAYDLIASKAAEMKTALESAATAGAITSIVKEAYDLSDVQEDAEEKVERITDVLGHAGDAFDKFYERAAGNGSAAGALSAAMEDLGESLVENGVRFDRFSDKGRANFAALDAVVSSYSKSQSDLARTGAITFQDAASNTSTFVQGLLDELARQGVDTSSQLQYLASYAAAMTDPTYTMVFNADVSAAMAGINSLLDAAQTLTGALGGAARFFTGGQLGAGQGVPNGRPGQFSPSTRRPVVPSTIDLSAARAAAQRVKDTEAAEEAQKKLEDAEKSAGQAADDAGKQAADAQEDAAEAVKKHQEYLDQLADDYASFASGAFGDIKAEGDAFKSLQELGQSLVENGKSFNTMTEDGRSNFDALTSVFDSFGATLKTDIEAGVLSASEAAAKYREFATGIYGELVANGVKAQDVAGFFEALGVQADGWTGSSDSVQQYAGFMTAAGDAAKDTTEALKEQQEYLDALGDAWANFASTALSGISAEGDVFESLQKLGVSLEDNGKRFNTVTEDGRANFAALTDTLDAFGETLSQKVKDGSLTAKQANDQYMAFASGLYGELVRLGVSAQDIAGFFKGIGVTAGDWNKAGGAVSQYAGYVTTANGVTKEAAAAAEEAALATLDYGAALKKTFDKKFGIQAALDSVQSAINGLKNTYQEAIDKVKELREENKSLAADLSEAKSDKAQADIEKAISKKYGETDRYNEYDSQSKQAQVKIDDIKGNMSSNTKQANTLEKSTGLLKGNSDEAIANRKSLRDLQSEMLDQIQVYADNGATTEQLKKRTGELRVEFEKAAKEAGYTKDDVKDYASVFDSYIKTIGKVPTDAVTEVKVKGVDSAKTALGSIPKGADYTTTAKTSLVPTVTKTLKNMPKKADYVTTAKTKDTGKAKDVLNAIPHGARTLTTTAKVSVSTATQRQLDKLAKVSDYVIKPKVDQGSLGSARNQLNSLGGVVTPTIKPVFSGNALSMVKEFFTGTTLEFKVAGGGGGGPKMSATTFEGGYIGPNHGYNAGGLVPGKPPTNPRVDNLRVSAPGGNAGLRSGEFVMRQEAVDRWGLDFFNYLNGSVKGFSVGAMAQAASYNNGGGGHNGPTELSPYDRALLMRLGGPTALYSNDRLIADSGNSGNGRLTRLGKG